MTRSTAARVFFVIVFALVLVLEPLPAAAQESAPAPSLSLGVRERVLENGLTVLTIERPRAPRATCWLFFKTGSVNERPGITGISHLFEHLMFKGTKKIGVRDYAVDQELGRKLDEAWDAIAIAAAAGDEKRKEELRKEFEALRSREKANVIQDELWDLYLANGATGLNAWTSEDMTAYIVTLPSNRVELFMWLESDRLENAVFREFYPERDVVKEERRLDENSPDGPFREELYGMFFLAHPYGWPVVGWMSDLDAITPEDCRRYFDIYYAPNNAVLVIVGDVKAAEIEKAAQRYFGPIPRGKRPPPRVATLEPRPAGERRLTVRAQAQPRATLLYHCPKVGHADGPALSVAQAVLSGKTGRLHEALVERDEIAVDVKATHDERRHAGVFEVTGFAAAAVPPTRVAEALQVEMDRLALEPVPAAELERAKNRLQAGLLKQLESPEDMTSVVGVYACIGDWRLVERLPALWQAVTAADVQRVAKEYFGREVRTTGILLGEAEGERHE